jgi:hypothetical protein
LGWKEAEQVEADGLEVKEEITRSRQASVAKQRTNRVSLGENLSGHREAVRPFEFRFERGFGPPFDCIVN